MKKETHPTMHPVIYRDVATGKEFFCRSTQKSQQTREIDGVTYFVHNMDVTAFSHPFFTGESRMVDAEGRIDRFRRRFQRKK